MQMSMDCNPSTNPKESLVLPKQRRRGIYLQDTIAHFADLDIFIAKMDKYYVEV